MSFSLHLKQQERERERLKLLTLNATKVDTQTGMPIEALIFCDAMTSSRGNTPKFGVKRHSKPGFNFSTILSCKYAWLLYVHYFCIGATILNRVFGIQVVCGPHINFMMYCSVDQLVAGGANLAIEIQRIAIMKLNDELL